MFTSQLEVCINWLVYFKPFVSSDITVFVLWYVNVFLFCILVIVQFIFGL